MAAIEQVGLTASNMPVEVYQQRPWWYLCFSALIACHRAVLAACILGTLCCIRRRANADTQCAAHGNANKQCVATRTVKEHMLLYDCPLTDSLAPGTSLLRPDALPTMSIRCSRWPCKLCGVNFDVQTQTAMLLKSAHSKCESALCDAYSTAAGGTSFQTWGGCL